MWHWSCSGIIITSTGVRHRVVVYHIANAKQFTQASETGSNGRQREQLKRVHIRLVLSNDRALCALALLYYMRDHAAHIPPHIQHHQCRIMLLIYILMCLRVCLYSLYFTLTATANAGRRRITNSDEVGSARSRRGIHREYRTFNPEIFICVRVEFLRIYAFDHINNGRENQDREQQIDVE